MDLRILQGAPSTMVDEPVSHCQSLNLTIFDRLHRTLAPPSLQTAPTGASFKSSYKTNSFKGSFQSVKNPKEQRILQFNN